MRQGTRFNSVNMKCVVEMPSSGFLNFNNRTQCGQLYLRRKMLAELVGRNQSRFYLFVFLPPTLIFGVWESTNTRYPTIPRDPSLKVSCKLNRKTYSVNIGSFCTKYSWLPQQRLIKLKLTTSNVSDITIKQFVHCKYNVVRVSIPFTHAHTQATFT